VAQQQETEGSSCPGCLLQKLCQARAGEFRCGVGAENAVGSAHWVAGACWNLGAERGSGMFFFSIDLEGRCPEYHTGGAQPLAS
jgi:hypothetical protein